MRLCHSSVTQLASSSFPTHLPLTLPAKPHPLTKTTKTTHLCTQLLLISLPTIQAAAASSWASDCPLYHAWLSRNLSWTNYLYLILPASDLSLLYLLWCSPQPSVSDSHSEFFLLPSWFLVAQLCGSLVLHWSFSPCLTWFSLWLQSVSGLILWETHVLSGYGPLCTDFSQVLAICSCLTQSPQRQPLLATLPKKCLFGKCAIKLIINCPLCPATVCCGRAEWLNSWQTNL